jgi:hypothetical protein
MNVHPDYDVAPGLFDSHIQTRGLDATWIVYQSYARISFRNPLNYSACAIIAHAVGNNDFDSHIIVAVKLVNEVVKKGAYVLILVEAGNYN